MKPFPSLCSSNFCFNSIAFEFILSIEVIQLFFNEKICVSLRAERRSFAKSRSGSGFKMDYEGGRSDQDRPPVDGVRDGGAREEERGDSRRGPCVGVGESDHDGGMHVGHDENKDKGEEEGDQSNSHGQEKQHSFPSENGEGQADEDNDTTVHHEPRDLSSSGGEQQSFTDSSSEGYEFEDVPIPLAWNSEGSSNEQTPSDNALFDVDAGGQPQNLQSGQTVATTGASAPAPAPAPATQQPSVPMAIQKANTGQQTQVPMPGIREVLAGHPPHYHQQNALGTLNAPQYPNGGPLPLPNITRLFKPQPNDPFAFEYARPGPLSLSKFALDNKSQQKQKRQRQRSPSSSPGEGPSDPSKKHPYKKRFPDVSEQGPLRDPLTQLPFPRRPEDFPGEERQGAYGFTDDLINLPTFLRGQRYNHRQPRATSRGIMASQQLQSLQSRQCQSQSQSQLNQLNVSGGNDGSGSLQQHQFTSAPLTPAPFQQQQQQQPPPPSGFPPQPQVSGHQYQTGNQQHFAPSQNWGAQQPMDNPFAQQQQPQHQFGSNQQYSASSQFAGGQQSQPQFNGQRYSNASWYPGEQQQNQFGNQQYQNLSQYEGGQYFPDNNGAFMQQSTRASQMPSGQQLPFGYRNGDQQQFNTRAFPGGPQPIVSPFQQQTPSSFQMNHGRQQSWSGQQNQEFPGFLNMQQQPLNDQQPLNAPPSEGYESQSLAGGSSSYHSTQRFPAGHQQLQSNFANPSAQQQHQGLRQSFPTPNQPQGFFLQPVRNEQFYGGQQFQGTQQPLLSQAIPQGTHSQAYEDNDGYYGDDDEDEDAEGEEEDDYGYNDARVNFVSLGGPPEDLFNDPIYQQTVQQVSALQKQFKASPKGDAVAVPALPLASLSKYKRNFDEIGHLDFDEVDFEEAVHEAKRRRIGPESQNSFNDAQKFFNEVGGPAQVFLPEAMDQDEPEFSGLDLDLKILGLGPEFKGVHDGAMLSLAKPRRPWGVIPSIVHPKARNRNFRLFESTCSSFWLMIEITKHLRVKDLVNLYSVSRTFHGLVNGRFQSTIAAWAQHMSPAGWKVFYWKFYGKYTIQDPAGLTWAAPGPVAFPRPVWDVKPRLASNKNIRQVPSFKYLAMLEQRETRTRDILACLARAGHRLPKTAHITLKKIWLLMDCATNAQRRGFIHNQDLWTDRDLYNAQMFFVKLHMRFNEPIFGPNTPLLADTFLGSKDGLTPLWKLLRRKAYTDPIEVIQQRLRYWVPDEDIDHWRLIGGSGKAYWDVPPGELGEEHREGWGAGILHMMRPDELVVEECVRREIAMQEHILFMVFWGHVDFQGRRNLIPTEEEMYMSDEDELPLPAYGPFSRTGTFGKCGNVPFEYDNWQPKHAMKARWKTLTREEKLWIVKDDNREQEDTLVWEEDGNGFWNDFNANDYPDPEEEDRQAALRAIKPNLTDLDRKVLDKYKEKKADGDEIDYADIVSLSGSSDSFFAPVIPTGEPELDPAYRMKMEEERARVAQPNEYVYEDEEIPPIPHNVTDPLTIANWADMDPYLHGLVIQEHKRLELQDRKDERTLRYLQRQQEKKMKKQMEKQQQQQAGQNGTNGQEEAPSTPPRYHYDYPSVTDPHLLSMLRRYDQFAPEAFGDQFPPSPEKKPHERLDREDWEDADDEGLQALGDVDYDSEELDFDVDVYQKFLDRVGDNGGCRRLANGEGDVKDDRGGSRGSSSSSNYDDDDDKKKGGKGKRKAGEAGEDTMMMMMMVSSSSSAHEADVLDEDDDIPFPKYEFRHF